MRCGGRIQERSEQSNPQPRGLHCCNGNAVVQGPRRRGCVAPTIQVRHTEDRFQIYRPRPASTYFVTFLCHSAQLLTSILWRGIKYLKISYDIRRHSMDCRANLFPSVLRESLQNKICVMPDETEWTYPPALVYRGVRITKSKPGIERSDFLSQIERGVSEDFTDIGQYSCSVFTDPRILAMSYKLPRHNKRIAVGQMKDCYGPCFRTEGEPHIHWFLYESADPSDGFVLMEE